MFPRIEACEIRYEYEHCLKIKTIYKEQLGQGWATSVLDGPLSINHPFFLCSSLHIVHSDVHHCLHCKSAHYCPNPCNAITLITLNPSRLAPSVKIEALQD